FRDLLVVKVSGSDELLESAICERDELKRQSELFSEADLVRFFHSLAETETLLKTATHPRYQMEVGLVKLMEMRRLESLSRLLDRLAVLEESVRGGKPPAEISPGRTRASETATINKSASLVGPAASAGSSSAAAGKSQAAASSQAASGSFSGTAAMTARESEAPSGTLLAAEAAESSLPLADTSEVGQIKAALEKRRKMFLV